MNPAMYNPMYNPRRYRPGMPGYPGSAPPQPTPALNFPAAKPGTNAPASAPPSTNVPATAH
jgi:hypothetical protein